MPCPGPWSSMSRLRVIKRRRVWERVKKEEKKTVKPGQNKGLWDKKKDGPLFRNHHIMSLIIL